MSQERQHVTQASIPPDESEAGKWVSEADYWAYYYDHPYFAYEWNNGILEEVGMPDYAQILLYGWFQALLRNFLEVQPIAKMFFLETACRLPLPDKTTIRKPDLFIVRDDNPVPVDVRALSYAGIADLCIESISDSDRHQIERDVTIKHGEYELIGVHEYFILDAQNRYMVFYRRTPDGDYVAMTPDAQGVIRSAVLPGFQFRVTDLFRQPTLIEMSGDPVYAAFVLPAYQAEKRRADQAESQARRERARAEQERAQAQQERERAERLATRLRELGIDPDA
jgi:Uma2 family endonuclease